MSLEVRVTQTMDCNNVIHVEGVKLPLERVFGRTRPEHLTFYVPRTEQSRSIGVGDYVQLKNGRAFWTPSACAEQYHDLGAFAGLNAPGVSMHDSSHLGVTR